MIPDLLRSLALRVPPSIRRRIKSALRWLVGNDDRARRLVIYLDRLLGRAAPPQVTGNDRVLAERLGLFDAPWYCAQYPDVVEFGADPFVHYMRDGWRSRRRPAPGFGAEDYAQVEQRFDLHVHNPITHLLQVGLSDAAVCRWLENAVRPAGVEQAASIRLHEGVCLIGYLRSEIGLGQAARNLAYACDAQRCRYHFAMFRCRVGKTTVSSRPSAMQFRTARQICWSRDCPPSLIWPMKSAQGASIFFILSGS